MATTTPERRTEQTREGSGASTIAKHPASREGKGRTTTMQAIMQDRYGSPDVLALREIAMPAIGDGDVLVRVHAAGLHSGDWHLMTGQPYLMRLMGFGFRAPKPAHLAFAQAAAVPTSACTALQALRDKGEIQPGQKVLIVGASGGVGMFAVQIAKAFGAEVTGVCSTAKVDTVRSLGAAHVIDYTQEDFTRSGQRYDLILDMGGNRALSQLRRALTPQGTLVLVGGEGGGRWIGAAMARSLRALVLSPFVRQRLRMVFAAAKTEDLRFLTELIEGGKVTPVIDRPYALDAVPDAIRYLNGGHARGKIVITV